MLPFVLQFTSLYVSGIAAASVFQFSHRHLPAVTSPLITDASGLASSRIHKGVLYTHNDENNPHPFVFALNASTSALIATLRVFPATNEDWEDIAVGPCGNESCIYILSSKTHRHHAQRIYRVKEPEFLYSDQILLNASKLNFEFQTDLEDNPCDTLMVDPRGHAFVISTTERGVGYIPSNLWSRTDVVNIDTQEYIHYHGDQSPMAGDISPDGTEIIILFQHHILLWSVHNQYNYIGALRGTAPHKIEWDNSKKHMQGICWDDHGEDFYINQEGQNKYIINFVRHH